MGNKKIQFNEKEQKICNNVFESLKELQETAPTMVDMRASMLKRGLDVNLPELEAQYQSRYFRALLKEGFSEIEALELMVEFFRATTERDVTHYGSD